MEVQPAATLSPIPEFPALSDRAAGTYNSKAYAFGSHMGAPGPFVGEMNALADNVKTNALAAEAAKAGTDGAVEAATAQADAAMGYRNTASAAASTATGAAGIATTKRDEAVAAAGQAVPAAATASTARDQAVAAAAVAGAPLVATSSTSLAVTVATKNLDVGIGKGFAPGQTVTIARTSAPATVWMRGTVLSYSSTGAGPLSVAVAEVAGSGTFTDWSISVSGDRGASSFTLPTVHISINTVAVPNVFYVIDAVVELKAPPIMQDGDFLAFSNRSGGVPTVNPNGKKIKGDSGVLYLNSTAATALLKHDAANNDLVESFGQFTVASISSDAILLQTNNWAQNQNFQGFTTLGDSAPAVKQKLITGVTASAQGGSTVISLGAVDYKKIVGLQAIVRATNASVPPNNSNSVGYQYSCSTDAGGVGVYLSASNSSAILNMPFTVLVTYVG